MDPALIVTLWFSLGIVLQIVPQLPTLEDVKVFFVIMIGSFLVSLVPGKNEHDYDLHAHLVEYFIVSVGAVFVGLRDKLIPRLNEHIVVVNTVIFYYALLYLVPPELTLPIAIISVLPTSLVMYSIYERSELDYGIQVALYFWNDVMYLLLFVVQYVQFVHILPTFSIAAGLPIIELVMSGMMFSSFVIPLLGLLYLIPLPYTKHQTYADRLAEIRDYLDVIVGRFTEENTSLGKALFIGVLTWGVLSLNRIYHFVNDYSVINFLVIGIPFVIRPSQPGKPSGRILSMRDEQGKRIL
jgi:hypothetical protein